MQKTQNLKRWYDKSSIIPEALNLIGKLPHQDQEILAESIINFVSILRKNKSEDPDTVVSLGKNRVIGLYKSVSRHRWYDQNPVLKNAANMIASLPEEDANRVAQGIVDTLQG